jgi:hypothetical protein
MFNVTVGTDKATVETLQQARTFAILAEAFESQYYDTPVPISIETDCPKFGEFVITRRAIGGFFVFKHKDGYNVAVRDTEPERFFIPMKNTVYFHSFAAKNVFVRQQRIQRCEIVSQTEGSITFHKCVNVNDFKNNVHVFSVQE